MNIFVLQEITTQQMMTHLNSVKKDLVILEKSEFSMLRSETEVCLKLLDLLFFITLIFQYIHVQTYNYLKKL